MQFLRKGKSLIALLTILFLTVTMTGCGAKDSGDPKYEAQVIAIEGLNQAKDADVSITEISITELRKLPQHDLDASYKRTTGLYEEFKMSGPYLTDVIKHLGGDLNDYAGIGVLGSDGYYCLLSKELIKATPDLMLAVVIDKNAKLDEDNAPARLAVQGQFGPYWVKRIEKIILYKQIPEKVITSVWIFNNLAAGIEPYQYEYYGSKDDSIDLEQIFSRLDHVDSKAFFTMKSADGFKKNEVLNMVKSRYYIKVEGKDAPTNVSPYIKLGMNVQNIAWVSTNADAAIFPGKMMEYMDTKVIDGQKGITLDEVLYETEVKQVKSETFDILGTKGEKITVAGKDMSLGILVPQKDGSVGVVWDKSTGYKNMDNLLRIRLVEKAAQETEADQPKDSGTGSEKSSSIALPDKPAADTILTITGDGVSKPAYLSLADLQKMKAGYMEQCFSAVNNYPTRKFMVAKGINLLYLLEQAGIKSSARSIHIEASDGYKATLTRDQLLGKRYRYPGLKSASTANPVEVKPMLAWAFGEGQDFAKAREGELRLVIGQQGLNDVNTAVSVEMISKVTVSTKDNGRWEKAAASLSDGQITLQHDNLDQVKLHYTLNGTEPNEFSQVYNPSTSYFQPDLIKPIPVNGSGTLKVKVIGYGKSDSEVLTYAY
ncbi:MAG TPA: chitobiase/beta-hexosaminidase C-terminal domain-containing protein [Syntrophomonas sp.]|nr:chitobiase/beta-hexosaminidase C-terminal domain-containing protein [Syntrophomonas sp.]